MDRSVLNKATSSDDVPTPGYLFTEIAKSTFEDVNVCQQLADYLLKKLERDDPLVKVKVLRIIRHVCDQGKPDFRRAVQKRADVVKACLQYRGKPDALKGDAPNKAVRDEADVAVKSVFSSDTNTNAYGAAHQSGAKMQGFGSDSADGNVGGGGGYGGGGGSGGYGGSGCSGFGGSNNTYGRGPSSFGSSGPPGGGSGGMVGFGNPNFDNSAPVEKDSMLKSAVTGAFSAASSLASKVPGVSSYISTQEPQMDTTTSTYRAPTAPGAPGGGFGGGPGGFGSGTQGRWGADAPPSQRAGGYGGAAPPVRKEAGEYEARVVLELCAPGGPRVAPSEAALSEFARKCESLDSNCIGDQLRQKLAAPDWQTRLKALYAVESLQQHGLDGIVGHVSQFSSELLFECQQMPQCRQKASKVLQVLGFIDQADSPAAKASVPAATAAPPVDLLDMGDGPAAQPAAAAPIGVGGGFSDLLDGSAPAPASNGYAPPSAAAPTVALDMLDFGGGAAPAPAGQAAPAAPSLAEGGGLFGSLSMAPSAAAPAPATAAASVDLAAEAQATDPAAAAGGGLFGNLQLGGASMAPTTQPSPSSLLNAVQGGAPPAPLSPATQLQQQLQQQQQLSQQLTLEQQQQQELAARRAHLNVLSGGVSMTAPVQGGAFPGAMGWPQQGAMMVGMAQAMPGAMSMQMMQPQMQPQMQMQMPMQPYTQQMTGAGVGAMGMQQAMAQQQQATYAGAPTAPAGAAGPGGPGSAFGFIGGGGGVGAAPAPQIGGGVPMGMGFAPPAMGMANPAPRGSQPSSGPATDNAFSFVADQMKGASA